MAKFKRLLRFKDDARDVWYGELDDLKQINEENLMGLDVPIYEGGDPWDPSFVLNGSRRIVREVLSPLPSTPIFLCVGLNYKQHASEANELPTSGYPTIFTKPPDALAGPFEDISIHPECQYMDYEEANESDGDQGELGVVLKKDCKNFQASEDVSQYILGYFASNDVSSRYWQMPERSGNQHGSAKSFDKFAPVGPVIASPDAIPDPTQLTLQTRVNGELRQKTRTDDMIFDIPAIIQHLSRGTTLRKGTVILTGTPSGVAAFMKPPAWLNDGDIVEVEIEGIGTIRNKMVFERT